MNAKQMSAAIRGKRKEVKEEGLENMLDTGPAPQMNPQDILLMKQEAQWDETMDLSEKSMAPSDPADADIAGTSQDKEYLKRELERLSRIIGTLKLSGE